MHELSITLEIINIINNEIDKRDLKGIDEIGIRVGVLSGIDPEALAFSFQVATSDTRLAHVKLNIQQIPIAGMCRACKTHFTVEEYAFACPVCQSTEISITQGEELDIEYLIEQDAEQHEQED